MQTMGSPMACYKMWRFIWVPNVCQYFCFQKTETSLCNLVSGISVCTTDHSKCKQWGPGWRVTERGVSSGSALLVRNLYLILCLAHFHDLNTRSLEVYKRTSQSQSMGTWMSCCKTWHLIWVRIVWQRIHLQNWMEFWHTRCVNVQLIAL